MPRARQDVTVGEWAVLALLSEEPTHGFALARAIAPDGEVGQVWSVRRPLVYRALENLTAMELVRPKGVVASRTGPRRTVLEATPAGKRAITRWLDEPVDHVRDARSLLMLKLLFLSRREADPEPLLLAQRKRFANVAEGLGAAAEDAAGFERALAVWRLESTTAALRFVDTMLGEGVPSRTKGAPVRR
jgi:DNA-binding PadR family transcriptional regulator